MFRNKISAFLLILTFFVTISNAVVYYFEAVGGGVLTAQSSGEVFTEEPQFDSKGTLILAQQWTPYDLGDGALFFVSGANWNNEVYEILGEEVEQVVIWNLEEEPLSSGGDHWRNSKYGGCLVNNGIGTRVNTTGKCDDPTMTDVWIYKNLNDIVEPISNNSQRNN